MQMRYVTVVIFLNTIQLINDLVDYKKKLFVILIKNRLQTGNKYYFWFIKHDFQ